MKNFLAVIAGLAVVIVISTGLDYVMHRTGVFSMDNTAMTTANWLLALAYRLVAAIAGGWVTARLAQSRPIFLAIVLGIIGSILGGAVSHMFSRPTNQRFHPAGLIFSTLGAILVLFICFKLKIHFPAVNPF